MTLTQEPSLGRIDLLRHLDDDALEALSRRCSWRRYRQDEIIIDRQSDSHDVLMIVDGQVRIVIYSLAGREISFDDIKAGGLCGELAAIDGNLRSASIVALADTRIAIMPARVFVDLVTNDPIMALMLLRRLTAVVRASTSRIMDLSTLAANNRVHAELLRLARASLEDDNSAVIRPIPIHSDLASRVSTTRETVARVMSDLAKSGVVARRRDGLQVTDFARLEEMVEDVRGDTA